MPKASKTSGAPIGIMAGGKKGDKKPTQSKSAKAGLTFPVARINRYMKINSDMKRIGGSAPVYMTAVVEYITAEVLELAGNATKKVGRKTVTPDDLTVAVRGDIDLAKMFSGNGVFVGDKIKNISKAIAYTPVVKTKKAADEE